MTLRLQVRELHLHARLEGFRCLSGVEPILLGIRASLKQERLTRLLLDLRGLAGAVAPADHEDAAELMSKYLQGIQCATLLHPWQFSGRGKARARERGLLIESFFTEAVALDWLLQSESVRAA